MLFPWNRNLETGNDVIDSQHKEIFQRVNRLLTAMSDGKGKDEIGKIVTFLTDYVKEHFNAEEGIMNRHRYRGYQEHKDQHNQFIRDFSRLKQEFAAKGATSDLVLQIKKHVCEWLRNHISGTDKAFVIFLAQQDGKQ